MRSEKEIKEEIREMKMQKELSFSALDSTIIDKWISILEWVIEMRQEV